jgi:hypothetical protein
MNMTWPSMHHLLKCNEPKHFWLESKLYSKERKGKEREGKGKKGKGKEGKGKEGK